MRSAFNSDPYVRKEIERVIARLGIEHVIETGTYTGATTKWFSERVKNVSTVELIENFYDSTMQMCKDLNLANIRCYLGSSADLLGDMITDMNTDKPILFYLDAHREGSWPLIKELETIGELKQDKAIVVIDDFKVPHRNKDYDTYGGHECSMEYIQHTIPRLYRNSPFIYFNDKHDPLSNVGKLYMFPAWMEEKLSDFVKKENDVYYSNL